MSGVNKAILVGNVGGTPDVRTLENGTKVANFSFATNKTYKKDGEKVTKTEWHRIVCFGKNAETVEVFVNKGNQLYIEGEIRTREWDDKDGNKRYTTEVVIDHFQMLGGKKEAEDIEEVTTTKAEQSDLPF